MFLVELSYNTIGKEIKDLDTKKNNKSKALEDSKKQLDKDNKLLEQFIETDNQTTSERNKEADNETHKRKTKETMIKQLDARMQNVKSDIDKNLDQLHTLEEHKRFLFHIFQKENAMWAEEQKEQRKRRLDKERRKWIDYAKLHKEVAFGFEEDPFDEGKSQKKTMPKIMTDQDWENRFEQLLHEDLIDVNKDFYDEDILYKDPQQLMDNFSYLED
mmetsp:Transcript_29569/g.45089  ORF Transcript_29569/g.45089 Transcript_29569/m.45089 type:complete len:216 (-) Transcript_29569:807-1454(-)